MRKDTAEAGQVGTWTEGLLSVRSKPMIFIQIAGGSTRMKNRDCLVMGGSGGGSRKERHGETIC